MLVIQSFKRVRPLCYRIFKITPIPFTYCLFGGLKYTCDSMVTVFVYDIHTC